MFSLSVPFTYLQLTTVLMWQKYEYFYFLSDLFRDFLLYNFSLYLFITHILPNMLRSLFFGSRTRHLYDYQISQILRRQNRYSLCMLFDVFSRILTNLILYKHSNHKHLNQFDKLFKKQETTFSDCRLLNAVRVYY